MTRHTTDRRRALLALAATASLPAWAQDPAPAPGANPAAKTGAALSRPAVPVRAPERAVLLAGAQAGARLLLVGERGLVLASEDQGRRWQQVPTPVSVSLTAVAFANAQQGMAVGHGGTVLVTADGGKHWTRRLDGLKIAALELAAAQASGNPAALRSAQALQADGPDKPLLDLLPLNPQRAIVVGAYGLCLATDDAGQQWTSWRARLDNPQELHLYAIRQRGQQLLIVGERGLVLLSDDLGQHFRRLKLPYAGSFFTAELPADGSLWVAGLRGNVWRSADGGASWAAVPTPAPVSITSSALLGDGSLLLGSQAGQVLQASVNAGPNASPNLQPLPTPALPPLNALLPLAGGDVLALTLQGLQRLGPLPRRTA